MATTTLKANSLSPALTVDDVEKSIRFYEGAFISPEPKTRRRHRAMEMHRREH